jgi:hypothetical protein
VVGGRRAISWSRMALSAGPRTCSQVITRQPHYERPSGVAQLSALDADVEMVKSDHAIAAQRLACAVDLGGRGGT